jgi:hypothetical protein
MPRPGSGDDDVSDPSIVRPDMFETDAERDLVHDLVGIFESSTDRLDVRLANFPRYALRTQLTRFLVLYELFKRVLPVKGSVVECGVFRGFSLFTWAKLSAILEPNNLHRRIYGFDSFAGFVNVHERDAAHRTRVRAGDFASGNEEELRRLVEIYDRDRFLGHVPKIELISGDMAETVPTFVREHRHLVVSLLFLDVDLYEPTKLALESFLPHMHAGSIVAFDELDNPRWPGETEAAMEAVGLRSLRLERLEFDPHISFAVLA